MDDELWALIEPLLPPGPSGLRGLGRFRPESLLGDKGYDSDAHRDALRNRRILPVIPRKGSPNIIGKLRCVAEQTFSLLHPCKRLAVRRERRTNYTTPSSSPPAA